MRGKVKLLSEVSSEMTFQIPTALSANFKGFFELFDGSLARLDVKSYGISVTTLEEVFLKVGHGDIDGKTTVKEKMEQADATFEGNEDYSIADEANQKKGLSKFLDDITALFLKRIYLYKRNYKGLVVEILIPVILVTIGLGFGKVKFFFKQNPIDIKPDLLPLE